ncbi:MAG: CPBP family intramembrane metalloprotease [Bacteroidales bacterium]|nr:CPBP family intramembrane metalloprotease [Bacteroidales bacterium]
MPDSKGSISSRIRKHPQRIRDVSLSVLGILLFAGFIHQPFPYLLLAIGGLAGAGVVIAYSIRAVSVPEAFGVDRLHRKVLLYSLPALVLGAILGIATRNSFDVSLFPVRITGVALVAPLVGAVEELIFRGYIQGHLHPIGRIFSVVYASTIHTCYKLLVILTLSIPLQFDFFFLVFWTFVGGLLFGALRELSGSAVPPVIAHAVFDVVLYGGLATIPVWVWS